MSSPYSTGGGGTQFETRVAAYYLAAALTEAQARALPGLYAMEVLTQRAAFEEPLDDLVISGVSVDGERTKLSLQVKSTLHFTEGDAEWVSVLGQAWQTFKQDDFDSQLHRLGVAIARYHASADQYYQSVLTWAAHSPSADNFIQRILRADFAHNNQRKFVEAVRQILTAHNGNDVSDDELWRFLATFRILHFDFLNEESSRDHEMAIDRIRRSLPTAERAKASQIWDRLVVRAGETTITGGGETRTSLLADLGTVGLPSVSNGAFREDIEKLNRESKRGMGEIKPDIHGLRLKRNTAYDQIQAALEPARFVQIDGEPGCGKSALLRQLAEEAAQIGPIIFLKDMRIQAGGWGAHAGQLGVADNLEALLRETACIGQPIIFIDGIDKISDPAVRLTVNDLIRAIATDVTLSNWKILATVREQNLDHIATWLDPEALKLLPIKSVTVPPFGKEELAIVANEFPRLAPLLREADHADVILRRPFFLESLISLAMRTESSTLPASEAELLDLWWRLGAADNPDFSPAQERRNVLLELSERFLKDPTAPISIRDMPSTPLEDLKSAGVIRDVKLGHTVTFAHDIYEEWSLAEWLMGRLPDVMAALKETGEHQELVRPLQLLGSHLLEFGTDAEEWKSLFDSVNREDLRPVWQRSLLTSCLRSTRSTEILNKLSTFLAEDDHTVFKKLLNALQTLEVVPNTSFLDEKVFPQLEPEQRVQYSHLTAHPKAYIWVRFFNWLFADDDDPSPELIPDLVPVFKTWQSTFAGHNARHCRRIGKLAHEWLVEFETALHPDHWDDRKKPFEIDFTYDRERDLEKEIRSLFLQSTGDVADRVAEYLVEKASGRFPHIYRDEIMGASNTIAQFLPKETVDYLMATFFKHPREEKSPFGRSGFEGRELGLVDNFAFYPASPLQPPFLVLLRQHPEEGLRLVREVCNFSIDVWRWLRERGEFGEVGVQPLPVEIEFPWGKQDFWGDGYVYCWYRGGHGNHVCQSALMALELWAFERIEAGADVGDIVKQIVEGNDSTAVLGLAVSIGIAHMEEGLRPLLPFMICPYVWQWDLARSVSDQTGNHANTLGDWNRYGVLLTAVRELNEKPHRKAYIRDLVPYFVFSDDEDIREEYTVGIRSFTERLPFELGHHKENDGFREALRKSMQWNVEVGDPQYWHSGPSEDGTEILFWNDPPSANDPERLAVLDHHSEQGRHLKLALWANKCLDENALNDEIPLSDAYDEAVELDVDGLFESAPDIHARQRAAGVAGVAFVLAKFADDEIWNEETATWTANTIGRSSNFRDEDGITFRASILSMHPLEFAAHGCVALAARGYDLDNTQSLVLQLALHPFEAVAGAIATASASLAANAPELYWEVFVLLGRRCIYTEENAPNYHAAEKSEAEAAYHQQLITAAENALEQKTPSSLPDPPMPWIKVQDKDPDPAEQSGYRRNSLHFLSKLASSTVLSMDFSTLMSEPHQREEILKFISQLIQMTFEEMVPPFAESRRDHGGHTPFEWVFQFFFWLGKFSGELTYDEFDPLIYQPIVGADDESAFYAIDHLSRGYAAHHILPPAEPDDVALKVWRKIAEWVIAHPEGNHLDHIDREFLHCVLTQLFCFSGDFGPLFCTAERDWPQLNCFADIFDRVIHRYGTNSTVYYAAMKFMQKGGLEFVPDPGVSWLHSIAQAKRSDQSFWSSNGEETVTVIKMIYAERNSELNEEHRSILSFVIDVLVDNGVRGAGFLQQDQHRKTDG